IVPLPEMVQAKLAPAGRSATRKTRLVESGQAVDGPEIVQTPGAPRWQSPLTFTVRAQVAEHTPVVAVTVRVKLPAAPAFTTIDGPTWAPTMVPLPAICQTKVAPGVGLVTSKTRPVESTHAFSGPVIAQLGLGLTL